MAYIYGRPGHHITAGAQRRDILLRIALPLLFLLALASAGLHAFLHGSYIITAFFVIFFVVLLLRFEELGLTLALRLSGAETKARANQVVAKTLRLLPDGYHVFHGLNFAGTHVDHAVVGPNGFFLITARTNLGTITESRESLRLNGWPFLGDLVGRSWRQSKALLRHLNLLHSGAVQVCPVLCFSRANVETERIVRGVMISQASTLVRMILDHESPLSSERILELTGSLARLTGDGGGQAEASHLDASAGEGASAGRARPACSKCRHIPSDLEADLFPGECPRCGRLYSAGHEDEPSAQPTIPSALGASAAPLVTACLIVACGAALLSYQAGLFDSGGTASARVPAPRAEADATPKAAPGRTPSTAAQPALPDAAQTTPAQTAPGQTDVPSTQAEGKTAENPKTADGASPASPEDDNRQPQAASATETPGGAPAVPGPQPPADPAEPDGMQDRTACGTDNATTPAAQAQSAPPGPKSPAGLATEGTLTVVTARPAVMWLTNDQTFKRFGPYRTTPRKALDIVLPKGCYTLVLDENGRRRQTTVSFLADTGRLEL